MKKHSNYIENPDNFRRGMDDPAAFSKWIASYSIKELSDLAGVSRRTLKHYDQIGLLKPKRQGTGDYRRYTKEELLRLQQILFFRELDFTLADIAKMMNSPRFDIRKSLEDHRALIEIRRDRLGALIETIDKTINGLTNKKHTMTDQDLYSSFSKEEEQKYAAEAKERWGNTEAYKQSQERYGKMSEREKEKVMIEGDALMKEIAKAFKAGESATGDAVQKLIAKHYEGLRVFYDPNPELYRGLGEMYVSDERFGAFFDKYASGLAAFMRDAMAMYADSLAK